MQFTILRENILNALQAIMGAIEKRQAMPILSHVLLNVTSTGLEAIATDLEVQLKASADLIEVLEAGTITVSARKLLDICKALPELSSIDFILKKETLLIHCQASRFKLQTLPADEYPELKLAPNQCEFTISQQKFREMLEKVHFCIANQDVRYFLNGAYLDVKNNTITVIATDGHRLAGIEYKEQMLDQAFHCIIPKKAISELLRLLHDEEDTLNIAISEEYLTVNKDDFVFHSKLISGTYPNYQKLIPRNPSKQVCIDKKLIQKVLARVSILSNELNRGVKLLFAPGKMVLEANNSEHEEAYEEIQINHNIEDFEIGFNVAYLLDAINVLPDGDINFLMSDRNSGVQIEAAKNPKAFYIVMPIII